jgi:aryl-alcohol dehydrogenase-like predicted oxidoreductase
MQSRIRSSTACVTFSRRPPAENCVRPVDRLILGTVQFGLPYGVSHQGGAVPAGEAGRMLELAWQGGVRTLDTAAAYGESEQVIGSLDAAKGFGVVTKTIPVRAAKFGDADISTIEAGFRASLEKLRRRDVEALLVHDVKNLRGRPGAALWSRLERLRADGAVGRIGVSVYDVNEAEEAVERFPIEIVQMPLSVFDQRSVLNGGLERLAARGVIIHARSVLLQGLLLMASSELPANLRRAAPAIERWRALCAREGVTPLAAALGFAVSQPAVAGLVVGAHSCEHLSACLAALHHPVALPWASLACDDPGVVDPRTWTQ